MEPCGFEIMSLKTQPNRLLTSESEWRLVRWCPVRAGSKKGSLTSAYRVENTTFSKKQRVTFVCNGAESEVVETKVHLGFLRASVITQKQIERSSY